MNGTLLACILIPTAYIGVSVAILRARDKGGAPLTIVKRSLGYVLLLFSLCAIIWIAFSAMFSTADLKTILLESSSAFILFTLVFCLITLIVAFLFAGTSGIENEDIDFDSPELRASVEEARTTLPYFIEQVSHHVDEAYIKFPLLTDSGCTEHIWAYVHHYENATFNVSLANDPYDQEGEYETRRDVPESEIEDWQIMLPDGSLKGAYSLIGAFRYLENQGKPLTKTMRKQKALLIDAQQ